MGGVDTLKISAGLRVGFWDNRATQWTGGPFNCIGYYQGVDLGEHLPGARLSMNLMEGELIFKVGVLFRPDLGKYQKLETILILETYVPEMFEYDAWVKEA